MIRIFNADPVIKQRTESVGIYVPTIVIGELAFGAMKSVHIDENLETLDDFVLNSTVLSVGLQTAHNYGRLKQVQRAKGRPIPDNDLWIAAITIEHKLALATRDERFKEIDDLQVEFWI